MCGIAGLFRASDRPAVQAMLEAMRHRGPDDEGIYADDRVTLGHRRLSIIDTSPAGHQPMAGMDGAVQIVFNGEIYNYREERARLEAKGRRFSTRSDTEVVLALYEEQGEEFLSHLRGMFAIALYDRRGGPGRETLLLARDHFGIKPLLYAERAGTLVFASELKGLLASGRIAREVDSAALRQLLSLGSVYQPRTLLRDVAALLPGHYLVADRAGCRIKAYWHPGLDRIDGLRARPYDEQVAAVSEALTRSVRLQMVGDVPVGAFLSGGVDSSLIVALMAEIGGARVKTFSVGFEDGADAVDESFEADEMARHLATDHNRVLIGAADIARHFQHFVRGLDQPSVDGLNSYFVSGAAAGAVTVALSGTGGDEIFLGYPWFAHIQRQFGSAPLTMDNGGLLSWLRRRRGGGGGGDNAGARFRQAFGGLYHCFGPAAAGNLLAQSRREAAPERSFAEDLAASDTLQMGGALDRASVLCLGGYTRNQLLRDIDACSMIHSLEVRVPFLDPVIADYALSLPPQAKLKESARTLDPGASYDESGIKRIVCDIARRHLPAHFFAERAKKGFSLPYVDWLKGPLAEIMADTLSADSVARGGLFDPAAVAAIRADFAGGRRPWAHPWLLMVTELWRREVLAA